jgi:DNA-binding NarL/FixJ family response regulator
MGEFSGIDIARQLRDSGSRAKIVFLTVHKDADYMNAAIGFPKIFDPKIKPRPE